MRSTNRNRMVIGTFVFFAVAGCVAGCAPIAPKELADARTAYTRASLGPATKVAPADLHKAEESLGKAEEAFRADPDAQNTRDLAYIAERKAQLAEALARQALENRKKGQAEQQYQKEQARVQQQTKGQLMQTREQLAEAERLGKQQSAQLGQEQQGRLEAERKAQEAAEQAKMLQENLTRLAAVKEEQRGMVITLSGSVLFPSDQALLLPEAQTRLDQVAAALMATKERNLIVEGHTDARGSEGHNLNLSQRRAEAVRNYLVSRGYEPDRVQARGIGKARPVANNASPEGRANNRRVEIVVEPKKSGE